MKYKKQELQIPLKKKPFTFTLDPQAHQHAHEFSRASGYSASQFINFLLLQHANRNLLLLDQQVAATLIAYHKLVCKLLLECHQWAKTFENNTEVDSIKEDLNRFRLIDSLIDIEPQTVKDDEGQEYLGGITVKYLDSEVFFDADCYPVLKELSESSIPSDENVDIKTKLEAELEGLREADV